MKKHLQKIRLLLTLLTMTILLSSPTSAASISKSQLKKKYKTWLTNYGYNLEYAKLKFIDVDKNGVIEALCEEDNEGVVITYNKTKQRVVRLCEGSGGKVPSPISYNTKKHMVVIAGGNREEDWADYYKIKGTKTTKAKSFFSDDEGYQINGKKVSRTRYKKQWKSAMKGFKWGWKGAY